ncbi:amidohydrolase family protein [Rhizobium sp. C4]|uniref:amidohydrolase family protein n=1 Tax=Rhizobium sp. C4 TaxID=1349800 RepID=UPI001E2F1866|nr:amidohydrolase family protein [Rhizobium sp. C4]MCD2172523.1 amidohydrolase family protein [Rhizobium sp. C4]
MSTILIKGANILSMDPAVGELHRGDILIKDDKIADIGPSIEATADETIDASAMIATPGFVDTHRHTWQSLLRSTGADWTLAQYFAGVRGVMGDLYTPDDMYVANLLGSLEALDAGITTLYDWSHNNNSPDHSDAAVRGLKDAGMRAVFGYGNSNREWVPVSSLPSDFADVKRVRDTHFASDDGLVTMAFAARGPQFATLDVTEEDFRKARELGLRITVHVGDGLWGMNKPLVQLNDRGLLADDTTYVHCTTLHDEDFKLMADTGGTASISPDLELNMGHGFPATLKLLQFGVRPSISIDIVTTVAGDMFNAMRALLSGTRSVVNDIALREKRTVDPLPLMTRDVLEFATLRGAIACGLGHKTGSLTKGKQADLLLINTNSLNMFPINHAPGAVVEAAHVGNIDSVFVAGKARKRHGKLLDVDVLSLRKRVDAARDALFERAGVPTDGSWLPRPFEAAEESEF